MTHWFHMHVMTDVNSPFTETSDPPAATTGRWKLKLLDRCDAVWKLFTKIRITGKEDYVTCKSIPVTILHLQEWHKLLEWIEILFRGSKNSLYLYARDVQILGTLWPRWLKFVQWCLVFSAELLMLFYLTCRNVYRFTCIKQRGPGNS